VVEIKSFQGFFSYARHDADTDEKLVEALTKRLEKRVSGKLTNARFSIWRDTNNLRTGDRWDDRIGDAVRTSHVFIILVTPKWSESPYCRKEYQLFRGVEVAFEVGEYVAPLLARPIDRQVENFDQAQKEVYDSLNNRQYTKMIAAEFLALTEDERETCIDKIADDIDGMIERLRKRVPLSTNHIPAAGKKKPTPDFDSRPHNLAEVDFVSAAEVLVEPPKGDELRSVFAHLSFVERLYVESTMGRVEFSVRRASLSIDDGGTGKLVRNDEWAHFSMSGTVYYVSYRPFPYAITVCMNPEAGRTGLSGLPLPPARNENFLSKPAIAVPDIDIGSIQAYLTVSLNPDGLFIAGEDHQRCSPKVAKKIGAIMSAFVEKSELVGNSEVVRRRVPVRERI
jgi:hypothetical protein